MGGETSQFKKRRKKRRKDKAIIFDNVVIAEEESVIIPGLFEPPVRTLRATIPENESHIFR